MDVPVHVLVTSPVAIFATTEVSGFYGAPTLPVTDNRMSFALLAAQPTYDIAASSQDTFCQYFFPVWQAISVPTAVHSTCGKPGA